MVDWLPRLARVALVGAVVLALVATAAGVLGVVVVRRSFPQVAGEAALAGLSGRVTVVRDRLGIPQVYADSAEDLFRAQGYVQAQDRFWEMDVRRHATAGRLAEMFGSSQVAADRFVRTLGWRRVAEEELRLLAPATRRWLDAYAQGVNAYLAQRTPGQISLEYSLLGLTNRGYRPERWTAADSVAWLKAMAWDLRGNMEDEIERAVLASTLPSARVEELYPPYPFDRHQPAVTRPPLVAGAARPLSAVLTATRRLSPALGTAAGGPALGSNAWAVSGAHTASGQPLLANDPHLGPSLPSVWYQMGLHCTRVSARCPFDVAGFTFAGVPGVIIGHNATVAWGFTNLGADVTDLYLERVDGDTYEYGGRRLPLQVRTETIEVAGGDPVTIRVRSTRHGPLLSDVSTQAAGVGRDAPVAGRDRPDYGVALRWTALTPGRTADAIFLFDRARSWADVQAAAARFEVPGQNIVYADVEGNIGYQAAGRIPVRSGGDGRWPVPGWTGEGEWTSYLPFSALPSALNPPEGYVASANQPVTAPGRSYLNVADGDYGFRSQRIVTLLRAAARSGRAVDVPAMERMQVDTWNANAAALTPHLLRIDLDLEWYDDGQDLMRGWDHRMERDSPAAAYFAAVWRSLLERTFHDEIPAEAWPDGGSRWFEVVRGLLERPDDPWWDDVRTQGQRETRDVVLRAALLDARLDLTRAMGKDPRRWRWGRMHTLTLQHQTFGRSGIAAVERLFNRGPLEVGGDDSVLLATAWTPADGYATTAVPSMRMVVDLADLDRSRWVNLTGASGHTLAAHYTDQAALWRDGRTARWVFRREAVEAAGPDRLVLVPG